MKRGNISKWKNIEACESLLLFSQLVNELLFDYSSPSNRVSTLNSHYLCLDALNAIFSIENNGVPEGNLKPIMEELYIALKKDPVFQNKEPLNYFVKYQGDKYNIISRVSDMDYADLKKTAYALNTCFFQENKYYEKLKEKIVDIVENNKTDSKNELYRLVKSILTELMNMGYTLRYIFYVMNKLFWEPEEEIISSTQINSFFDKFTLKEKEYEVVFVVNKNKIEDVASYFNNVEIEDSCVLKFNTQYEKQFFTRKNKKNFLRVTEKAFDPFAAANAAQDALSINIALYRLFDHSYRYDINSAPCGIYDEDTFYKYVHNLKAVEHTKGMSTKQIKESMAVFEKAIESMARNAAYNDLVSVLSGIRFHGHSLDSDSEENQLLDFWAIFESILDISNKHTSDRIRQVCMHLVPILKRKYIYSLFQQLAVDIKNYNIDKYNNIINGADTEEQIVQEICEFTLLEEKREERELFLAECSDFPLLKERIEYYSESLGQTNLVHSFVEKHAERVKWQIMRIYRNRNLIIHNAESMPYLSLLIENLHAYVDDFLVYVLQNLSIGHNIESMCQELFIKECCWNATFQRNNRQMNKELIQEMLSL